MFYKSLVFKYCEKIFNECVFLYSLNWKDRFFFFGFINLLMINFKIFKLEVFKVIII